MPSRAADRREPFPAVRVGCKTGLPRHRRRGRKQPAFQLRAVFVRRSTVVNNFRKSWLRCDWLGASIVKTFNSLL